VGPAARQQPGREARTHESARRSSCRVFDVKVTGVWLLLCARV